MITSFSLGILLAGGVVLIALCFMEYLLLQCSNEDCNHERQATFDSYHKKVCIDCGQEFSTTEIKK